MNTHSFYTRNKTAINSLLIILGILLVIVIVFAVISYKAVEAANEKANELRKEWLRKQLAELQAAIAKGNALKAECDRTARKIVGIAKVGILALYIGLAILVLTQVSGIAQVIAVIGGLLGIPLAFWQMFRFFFKSTALLISEFVTHYHERTARAIYKQVGFSESDHQQLLETEEMYLNELVELEGVEVKNLQLLPISAQQQ